MKINSLEIAEEVEVSHNPNIKKRVLISNGEIEKITNFAQAVFPPGEVARLHNHDNMTEVFLVQSGEGAMFIDGNVIALEPGKCVTVEPNELHELRNTGAINLVITYFGVET